VLDGFLTPGEGEFAPGLNPRSQKMQLQSCVGLA